jgi:hypothetical protein
MGGSAGVPVDFLDDGGAAPLLENKPSNGNVSSNQYRLITRLYAYFGTLLGCSFINTDGFPAYNGVTSMYSVHKFMDIDVNEFGYFVTQVGLAAASFGVAPDDLAPVGEALSELFGYRCAQPVSVLPGQPAELESICIDSTCPLADNSSCASYDSVVIPPSANVTVTEPGPSNTSTSVHPSASSNDGSGIETSTIFEIMLAFGLALFL